MQLIQVNGKILYNLLLLTITALSMSCSTGRNTSATRAYHELTTRYNIYHNAQQTYNQMQEDLHTNSSDNWFQLLSLHPTGGSFDAVIEKTTQSILEHSITAKPRRDNTKAQSTEYRQWLKQEEFNPFIHKVWLLLGKAYVMNGNYEEALAVFTEMERIFANDALLITETHIWKLRSYVGLNRMFDAQNMAYLLQTGTLPNHLAAQFNREYTNYLLANNHYQAALPYLTQAIDNEKSFLQKKRLQFLKAQIHILLDDKEAAYQSFNKIKGIRTPPHINRNATIYQTYTDSIGQILHQQFASVDTLIFKVNIPYNQTNQINTNPQFFTPKEEPTEKALSLTPEIEIIKNRDLATDDIEPANAAPKLSPDEIIKRLEQNEAEVIRKNRATTNTINRDQQLKEREKDRDRRVKEREKALKERERLRNQQLKLREQEREQRILKQKRKR